MFRGLLRCSFPCRHVATALVAAAAGAAGGVSAARMADYSSNAEANTLHDSLNEDRTNAPTTMTMMMPNRAKTNSNKGNTLMNTQSTASHLTAYYTGGATSSQPHRLPSVFAPMRRPHVQPRPGHTSSSSSAALTVRTDAQERKASASLLAPRNNSGRSDQRVVMTKAQQIRQAARHRREAQRAQHVNSPAAFLVLSAQEQQLSSEASLLKATLQRLQAEKALVQAKQECAEDMRQFALGIEQRRRALQSNSNYHNSKERHMKEEEEDMQAVGQCEEEKEERMQEGVYEAVIAEPGTRPSHTSTHLTSNTMNSSSRAMESEVAQTLAESVDATLLLGLPATADHEAALAMQHKERRGRREGGKKTRERKARTPSTRRLKEQSATRKKKDSQYNNKKKSVGAVSVQPARRRGRPAKQRGQENHKNNKTKTDKNKKGVAAQRKAGQATRRVGRPPKATRTKTQAKPHTKSHGSNSSSKAKALHKSANKKRVR